jgi:hypothetical protein
MKQFLRAALLVSLAALFLSAWSRPAGAASMVSSTNGSQAHSGSQMAFPPAADPRGGGTFQGIAAISATDIWAVGSGLGTLTDHWNGTKWSLVKSPSPGLEYNSLNGVAAISSNDAWAVGSYSNNPQIPDTNTLIEHWNGTKWSVVSHAMRNVYDFLYGLPTS